MMSLFSTVLARQVFANDKPICSDRERNNQNNDENFPSTITTRPLRYAAGRRSRDRQAGMTALFLELTSRKSLARSCRFRLR
jgi:hypothetical protein